MNTLKVKITDIQNENSLHVVTFERANFYLTMLSLDLSEALKVGTQVQVGIKATHLTLSQTKKDDISMANQIQGKITSVEMGVLLACIKVEIDGIVWESLITLPIAKKMALKVGAPVFVLFNASELSIVGVS